MGSRPLPQLRSPFQAAVPAARSLTKTPSQATDTGFTSRTQPAAPCTCPWHAPLRTGKLPDGKFGPSLPCRDKHRVFRRLSFRYEEAERLVEAAWARFEAERARGGTATHDHGESVRDRQVLYWFALTTEFRAKECASIRWDDLTLAHGKPAVRLAGQFTKNGDDALVPLQPFVAEAMARMRTRRSAHHMRAGSGPVVESDLVFHVPDKIARLVRKDAAFAGLIPLAGITTRRVDFHALRKSCARILIELGLHPKVIQQTLRHSDIRLTMDLYGELGEDDLFRELPGRVPVPRMFGVGGVG